MTTTRLTRFADFWPYYLQQHAHPTCRQLHYVGTALSLIALSAALLVSPYWLIAAPVSGYSFAWFAHFKFEKNKPATFQYPLWSLASDYRMFYLWLTGGLAPHLAAAGVETGSKAA